MRHLLATAAAIGFMAIALAPAGAAEATEDANPHLLAAGELGAPDERGAAPVILRGSAVDRKPVAEVRPSAAVWQIAAGRWLWLVDPVTEELRTCAVRQTSTVGVKELRCLSGSAGRFRRTFGPTFAP